MEGGPVAGGFAGAAVDHQVGRALGDVGVEVVHEHAQGGFLLPSPAAQGCAARGADDWGHGFMVTRGGSASRCLVAGGVVPEGAAICPFLLPGLLPRAEQLRPGVTIAACVKSVTSYNLPSNTSSGLRNGRKP